MATTDRDQLGRTVLDAHERAKAAKAAMTAAVNERGAALRAAHAGGWTWSALGRLLGGLTVQRVQGMATQQAGRERRRKGPVQED